MATLYTHQAKNSAKTWFLFTTFLVIVIGLGYFFSWYFQLPEVLYIVTAFAVVQSFVAYWFSDKIVLSMSGARPATREEFFDLYTVTENLAITAGLPMPKLYVIHDSAPNAFATGRNKKHAVVAVTTGLLQILNRTELEGVIAHELSHIGNRDMLVSTVVVVLVGFLTLLSDFFLRMTIFGGGRRDDREGGGQLQLILLIAGIVLVILSPIIGLLIQLAISRKREFLADASGALLTRYPEGLASALQKISTEGKQMKKANHATAHLFIANPFGPSAKKSWFSKLWMTHPPVEDRVNALVKQQ